MKAIVFQDSLVMHEVSINEILITLKKRLRIYRCAIGDTSPVFRCLMDFVISTRISGKYICSNFNINVLQKNGFCRL